MSGVHSILRLRPGGMPFAVALCPKEPASPSLNRKLAAGPAVLPSHPDLLPNPDKARFSSTRGQRVSVL